MKNVATIQLKISDKLYDRFRAAAMKDYAYTRTTIKREAYTKALELFIEKYEDSAQLRADND